MHVDDEFSDDSSMDFGLSKQQQLQQDGKEQEEGRDMGNIGR